MVGTLNRIQTNSTSRELIEGIMCTIIFCILGLFPLRFLASVLKSKLIIKDYMYGYFLYFGAFLSTIPSKCATIGDHGMDYRYGYFLYFGAFLSTNLSNCATINDHFSLRSIINLLLSTRKRKTVYST